MALLKALLAVFFGGGGGGLYFSICRELEGRTLRWGEGRKRLLVIGGRGKQSEETGSRAAQGPFLCLRKSLLVPFFPYTHGLSFDLSTFAPATPSGIRLVPSHRSGLSSDVTSLEKSFLTTHSSSPCFKHTCTKTPLLVLCLYFSP